MSLNLFFEGEGTYSRFLDLTLLLHLKLLKRGEGRARVHGFGGGGGDCDDHQIEVSHQNEEGVGEGPVQLLCGVPGVDDDGHIQPSFFKVDSRPAASMRIGKKRGMIPDRILQMR